MSTNRRSHIAALLALALVAGGCEMGTEPLVEDTFDTQAALEDYEAMQTALQSEAMAGFQVLAGRSPFGRSSAGIAIAALRPLRDADDGRAFALDLAHRLVRADAGPTLSPIISDRHRGKTFVYDPVTDDYAVDPDRTGAPATGVRFITYAVDNAGYPIVDEETGYADLIDEGDGSAEDIVLHLQVVEGGSTVLDYRTSLDDTDGAGRLTVAGYLEGDGVRLDFDIEAAGSESAGKSVLDLAFEMRVDARDFAITGGVSGVEDGAEGEGDVNVTVRHRQASIEVDVRGAEGQLDGTFYLNGNLFATVTGDAEAPTFAGAGGDPLTGPEFLVLRQMLDTVEDVFDFLEDLVDPVDELVVLGIIL